MLYFVWLFNRKSSVFVLKIKRVAYILVSDRKTAKQNKKKGFDFCQQGGVLLWKKDSQRMEKIIRL